MIDVFAVGVRLSMTGNATAVLQEMMRHLTGIQGSTNAINANFTRMALLAGGAMAAVAGAAALRGLWDMVKAAGKLNDELVRMELRGGESADPASLARARSQAFDTARVVPIFAPDQLVKAQNELTGQLGHPKLAAEMLTAAANAAMAASFVTHEDPEKLLRNMIKIADLRAKIFSAGPDGKEFTDPVKVQAELNAMTKGLELAAGYMDSAKLLGLMTTGGLPMKGMTPEAAYAAAVELATSQGGPRGGTELTALFRQLRGGVMPRRVAEADTKAGMLEPGDWSSKSGGGAGGGVVLSPKGLARFNGIDTDPLAWATGPGKAYVENYAKKMNISMVAAVFQLFSTQTAQRLIAEAMTAGPQFERARALFGVAPDVPDQAKTIRDKSFETNVEGLSKAWTGLMQAVGDSAGAIALLQSLTAAIHALTDAVLAHPEATKDIFYLSTALAALVTAGGTLTVLTVGLNALAGPLKLLAGITGLAATAIGINALVAPLIALGAAVYGLPRLLAAAADAINSHLPDSMRRPSDLPGADPASRPQGGRGGSPNSSGHGHDRQSMGDVYIDGHKLGVLVANHLADSINRPTGSNSPDLRVGALYPGAAGNWAVG
jgi:hypothetical protein